MTKTTCILLLFVTSLIIACSGSDTYQGEWKATDNNGLKYLLTFSPKEFTLKDTTGKIVKFNYTQNSVKINNGIKSYGINLKDGRTYTILFPIANDETKAIVLTGNNTALYTLDRSKYINQDDLYKLTN